jgi:hypothetical protein
VRIATCSGLMSFGQAGGLHQRAPTGSTEQTKGHD